ncbi:hypothetical protein ABH922_001860 [Rhodococcus sp. 27YEA15]|uniref:phosphotransferase n=1 Tax=Rhodococcus sp. 27YEA15 TaxID=3156259 RepID=UPI003C7DF1F2
MGSGEVFVRPRLLALPAAIVNTVEDVLDMRIVREEPAATGFTPAVASRVDGICGGSAFVKAAPRGTPGGDGVRTGAELAAVIGDLGPPLIEYCTVEGWAVAIYEVIEGYALADWDTSSVAAMTKLSFTLRERLDPSPLSDMESYAEVFSPQLGTWSALAAADHPSADSVAHIVDRPLPYGLDVVELAALERSWPEVLESGATALQHGDIRRDNVMREPSGRLRLVDWTHRWLSPGWVDLVRVGPDIAACGHDPETFLLSSAWSEAPRHNVNVVLAGLAGRAWRDGSLPPLIGAPHLRSMQREQGEASLHWLAARLGRVR